MRFRVSHPWQGEPLGATSGPTRAASSVNLMSRCGVREVSQRLVRPSGSRNRNTSTASSGAAPLTNEHRWRADNDARSRFTSRPSSEIRVRIACRNRGAGGGRGGCGGGCAICVGAGARRKRCGGGGLRGCSGEACTETLRVTSAGARAASTWRETRGSRLESSSSVAPRMSRAVTRCAAGEAATTRATARSNPTRRAVSDSHMTGSVGSIWVTV